MIQIAGFRSRLFAASHDWAGCLWRHRSLIGQLVRRDVLGRYRGSMLGVGWSFLQPLFMLTIYSLVFGFVFKTRWPQAGAALADGEMAGGLSFSTILFVGLLLHGFMAECLARATGLIAGHTQYVKKLIFPVEILPWTVIGSALLHLTIGMILLLGTALIAFGRIPITALALPVILVPFIIMMVGIMWGLAALGVFLRDIGQIMGVVITATLFLSPVFFPRDNLPPMMSRLLDLNPLTLIVDQSRKVLLWGQWPDFTALGIYLAIALVVAWGGFYVFSRLRRAFADVL